MPSRRERKPRFWQSAGPGQPDPRIPYVLALAVGTTGVLGQWLLYAQAMKDDLTPGILLILVPNFLSGVVAMFGMDPFSAPASTDVRRRSAMTDAGVRSILVVLVVSGVQLLLGLPAAIALTINGPWHDPSVFLTPFLLALFSLFGGFAGLLVGMLVLWPIVTLVRTIIGAITGRRPTAGVVPFALLFLLTIGTAVFGAVAPSTVPDSEYSPRARGGALLVSTWTTSSDDPTVAAILWMARAFQVLLVADLVWLIIELRAAQRAKKS